MTSDHATETATPVTWIDAFPWIRGVASSEQFGASELTPTPVSAREEWWTEVIAQTSRGARRRRIAMITEHAMESLPSWPIGKLFPGLPDELPVSQLDLPSRAQTALNLADSATVAEVSDLSINDLFDLRHVGVGTVEEVLKVLAHESTSIATVTVTSRRADDFEDIGEPESTAAFGSAAGADSPDSETVMLPGIDTRLSAASSSVNLDFVAIAEWFVAIGRPDAPLLHDTFQTPLPPAVVEARKRLFELTGSSFANDTSTVDMHIDHALDDLDERAIAVLATRAFADTPRKLDEIGADYDVSRERVRQIESKAQGQLLSTLRDVDAVNALNHAIRDAVDPVRPLEDLLQEFPVLASTIKRVGQPVWRILDRLDAAYEIADGWCASRTLKAARSATAIQLEDATDEYGIARLVDVSSLVTAGDSEKQEAASREWLSYCGYTVFDDYVLTRTSSVLDYAAAALVIEGEPMDAQAMLDRFSLDRSVRSLRNVLAKDERFRRVDRDRWALSEWDFDTYEGIRPAIRELIDEHGGQIGLDELIESITGRFSVSENSVLTYASAPPFECRHRVVSMLTTLPSNRKSPAHTKRLFRRHDGWVYRIVVTTDHLRGSGSPAPIALAQLLEVNPGESKQMPTAGDHTPQMIAWKSAQPHFGTIRRLLVAGDLSAGDHAHLVFGDDGVFDIESVRPPSGDPVADALALTGQSTIDDPEESLTRIATAIGLSPDARVSDVIAAARGRGDEDLADLLAQNRVEPESTLAE